MYLGDAFRDGMSLEDAFKNTSIDRWFLAQIKDLIDTESWIAETGLEVLEEQSLRRIKGKGFADSRIASLLGIKESVVRKRRLEQGVTPVFKRVDTCAAEFATTTAYLYSTYEEECEADPTEQ